MKYEWKKQEKELYLPKDTPALIFVPKHKFFAIKGKGNPNGRDFFKRIEVLYALAYAVRMMPKSGFTPDGYFEYTVYPLEAVWEIADVADKNSYIYALMIRQPDFVSAEITEKAFENVKIKKPHMLLPQAYFCEIEDGLSVQMMHNGDYDNEPASFAEMQKFLVNNELVRRADNHREIYLKDANKIEREQAKTVLRYSVAKLENKH